MKDTKELAELRRYLGEHTRTADKALEAVAQISARLADAVEKQATKPADRPWVEFTDVVGTTPGGVPVVALHPDCFNLVTNGSRVRVRLTLLES